MSPPPPGAEGALPFGRRSRWRNYFWAAAASIGRSIEGAIDRYFMQCHPMPFNVLYSKKGQQNIDRRWCPKKGQQKKRPALLGDRWRIPTGRP